MNEMLMMQLAAAHVVFGVNTSGVTHAQSLVEPAQAGNCMNWIAGHLVTTYNSILPAVGEEQVWDEARTEVYRRGSDPLTSEERAMDFDEIAAAFTTAHERLMRGLSQLGPDRMNEPAPFSPGNNPQETLGSLLHLIAFHQAYHVGQLGLGRRLLGLDGGVR